MVGNKMVWSNRDGVKRNEMVWSNRWCGAIDGVEQSMVWSNRWCEAKRVGVKRSEIVCGSARRLFWLPDNGKQMRSDAPNAAASSDEAPAARRQRPCCAIASDTVSSVEGTT